MTRERYGALALSAVILLLVVVGLYRIAPVDVPWHLQTGRIALETGHLPVTNTFSWTYPDYPLRQQYPLYQLPLALLVDGFGFGAFGLWNLALWTLAGVVWMRASGTFREAGEQSMLWLLVVLGLQRHHVPRPEVWTVLGMGLILLGFERWSRTRRGGWLGLVVLAQWLMVNGHQLWMFGLGIQGAFLLHLLAGRRRELLARGLDPDAADLPLGPPALAFLASVAVLPLSPLGLHVYWTPIGVIGTVLSQGAATHGGAHAQELMPVWTDPLAVIFFTLDLTLSVLFILRSRARWSVFDLLVWGSTFAMAAMAVRGISFFTLGTGWMVSRARGRSGPLLPEASILHPAAAATAAILSLTVIWELQTADAAYLKRQAGLGRSHGEWADATVHFLSEDPPPGRLMNLSWVAGNALVGMYPEQRLFVDPRFESYPREFLLQTIESIKDPAVLGQLLDTWKPTFVVAEMREPKTQQRVVELLRTGDWFLVHVDTILCVAVHREPETEAWLRAHETRVDALPIEDWVPQDEAILLAQQRVRVGRLYRMLGREDLAAPLIEQARTHADHPSVQGDLETVDALPH